MADLQDGRVSMIYDLAREVGLEVGEHPASEYLFEYQEGLLTAEEASEIQNHLALCSDCARMVLELAGSVEPEFREVEAPLSEERMAALWPGLRQRLSNPPQPKAARWRRSFERVALPLAASLLVATLATTFWAWSLSRENRVLARPRVNVAVRDLAPLSDPEIRREEGETTGIPRDAEAVLLVLNLADLRPFPTYRAEILEASPDGKLLWASDAMQRSVRGNFDLQIPRPFPGSGRYRIRLFGVEGDRREPLAEYKVDLSDAT